MRINKSNEYEPLEDRNTSLRSQRQRAALLFKKWVPFCNMASDFRFRFWGMTNLIDSQSIFVGIGCHRMSALVSIICNLLEQRSQSHLTFQAESGSRDWKTKTKKVAWNPVYRPFFSPNNVDVKEKSLWENSSFFLRFMKSCCDKDEKTLRFDTVWLSLSPQRNRRRFWAQTKDYSLFVFALCHRFYLCV